MEKIDRITLTFSDSETNEKREEVLNLPDEIRQTRSEDVGRIIIDALCDDGAYGKGNEKDMETYLAHIIRRAMREVNQSNLSKERGMTTRKRNLYHNHMKRKIRGRLDSNIKNDAWITKHNGESLDDIIDDVDMAIKYGRELSKRYDEIRRGNRRLSKYANVKR
jgi:hypothetical protein